MWGVSLIYTPHNLPSFLIPVEYPQHSYTYPPLLWKNSCSSEKAHIIVYLFQLPLDISHRYIQITHGGTEILVPKELRDHSYSPTLTVTSAKSVLNLAVVD